MATTLTTAMATPTTLERERLKLSPLLSLMPTMVMAMDTLATAMATTLTTAMATMAMVMDMAMAMVMAMATTGHTMDTTATTPPMATMDTTNLFYVVKS